MARRVFDTQKSDEEKIMKKTILFSLVVACSMTIVFTSCKKTSGRSSKIEYDSIVVAKHIPLLHENDTTLPYSDVNVRFTYPSKFRNAESLARLQQIFLGTFFGSHIYDSMSPRQAMDNYVDEYESGYKALSNDYYADKSRLGGEIPNWYWYSMSNENKILFQNDSLLSYAVEYSDYTGGAHGSFRVNYVNIDLADLVTLSEEDLFVPDYFRPLTEKIVNALMAKYGVATPDSLLAHGFFAVGDIVPNNNFWLNADGIHYAYNQYEIAPYAMGVVEISVPYADLEDIIIPGGIISRRFLTEK